MDFIRTLMTTILLIASCVLVSGCRPSAPAKEMHLQALIADIIEDDRMNLDDIAKRLTTQKVIFDDNEDPEGFARFLGLLYKTANNHEEEFVKDRVVPAVEAWAKKKSVTISVPND